MRLNARRCPSLRPAALDHVWVKRALGQKRHSPQSPRFPFEYPDETLTDDAALLLRVSHPVQRAQELLGRVHRHQPHTQPVLERAHHLPRLTSPQKACVDEDTGQLVAHGAVHQRRRHCGVDPTAEPAHYPARPHLGTYRCHRLLDEGRRSPIGHTATDLDGEAAQNLPPPDRMYDLGVELETVEPPLQVTHRRHGGVGAVSQHLKARRHRLNAVAVGHPHARVRGEREEERDVGGERHLCRAVFPPGGRSHPTAQTMGKELHPITDAQHRHALCQHVVR